MRNDAYELSENTKNEYDPSPTSQNWNEGLSASKAKPTNFYKNTHLNYIKSNEIFRSVFDMEYRQVSRNKCVAVPQKTEPKTKFPSACYPLKRNSKF